jgi:DNA-binding MarR family transcriptional regulator
VHDKLARALALTAKGEAVIDAVTPVVEKVQKEILPGLNEAEYKRFILLATKAVKAAGA